MIVAKMIYALFFFHAINICAMTPDADQGKWIKNARAAIKRRAAGALGEAMMHITDQKVKKHLFRKIAREKPEDTLLMEAVLASGLELESPDDKETLVQFVERKEIPMHIALVKKYLVLKELDGQATLVETSKPTQPEPINAKPIEGIAPKQAQSPKTVVFKEKESVIVMQSVEDSAKSSHSRLVLSKSGKINRRSLKNGNPLI